MYYFIFSKTEQWLKSEAYGEVQGGPPVKEKNI